MVRLFAGIVVLCFLTDTTVWSENAPPVDLNATSLSPDAVISKVIEPRRAIQSARIILHIVQELDKAPNNQFASREYTYTFYLAEPGRRIDLESDLVGLNGHGSKTLEQAMYLRDGSFVVRPIPKRESVYIGKERDVVSNVVRSDIDPRLLGLAPVSVRQLHEYDFESCFKWLRMGDMVADRTTADDGRSLYRLSSTYNSTDGQPVTAEWVIAPEENFSVVSIRVDRPDFGYRVAVTNKEWSPGTWYPSEAVFSQQRQNENFIVQRVTVEHVDIPFDPPPGTFDLTAMNIEPGRTVRRDREHLMWDGRELIPHPEEQSADVGTPDKLPKNRIEEDRQLPNEGDSFRTVLLWVNAGVFLALAVYMAWRRLR